MKILLTGGGTMGSVSPLLAIVEEIKKENEFEFLWIGTKNGPEKKVIENYKIPFKTICSGKLRRYFDWQNFIDIFKIKLGFWQSFFILLKWRPDIIISAGSFVSVPVIWAAWFLRIKILIHQQDIKVGLANKLMAPFAKVITVTFEKSLADYGKKAIWTGNPIRQKIKIIDNKLEIEKAELFFSLEKKLPVILVIGGGTGALELNKIIVQALSQLTEFCQIIHLTGGKIENNSIIKKRYFQYEFLIKEMRYAYVVADLVISRAGIGTLTELSYFKKPSILIPMPKTHQEENANFFQKNQASIILDQNELIKNKNLIIEEIKKTLQSQKRLQGLSENIGKLNKQDAEKEIVKMIKKLIHCYDN